MTQPINPAVSAAFEAVSLVASAVIGYRNQLVAGGVSPEAADLMARDFQVVLLAQVQVPAPQKRR